MDAEDSDVPSGIEDLTNRVWNAFWDISHYLMIFLDLYSLSFLEQCVSIVYAVYLRLTPFNMVIFFVNCVPASFYMYKFIKNVYATSRERLKQIRIELEDIQLQIQIVNTKMCVGDAQFNERAELLRRESERLRHKRARVRGVLAADAARRRAAPAPASSEDDNKFIMELIKSLKRENNTMPERNFEKMDCGEHADSGPAVDQYSLCSSLSDLDVRQDCSIKIVKVTNVYKVAYLKHYIKQKRLRRATKRATLKKKMENIKKLLEDWQKTLSVIINSKLTILNMDTYPMDVASQEAMGDYSKQRDSSDSDSDMRNNDVFYDNYSRSWMQNPYRPYSCNCEEHEEEGAGRERCEARDSGDTRHAAHGMSSIAEETKSQIVIEDIAGDANYCRDLVAI